MLGFRAPREDETETLTALTIASKAMWNYPETWLALWRPSLTITVEQIRTWHFELAESAEGNDIIGYFAVSSKYELAEPEHLWVARGYEGRGHGRRLFQRAVSHCRRTGVVRLRVVSDPNAKYFYCKLGCVLVGEVPSVPAPRTLPLLEFKLA